MSFSTSDSASNETQITYICRSLQNDHRIPAVFLKIAISQNSRQTHIRFLVKLNTVHGSFLPTNNLVDGLKVLIYALL